MNDAFSHESDKADLIFRVIDANSNRLREALRVIEEYFRFIQQPDTTVVELKLLRHSLKELIRGFDIRTLLRARDTQTDPFAGENREEEMQRSSVHDIVVANFKRAQEAARVLEEYSKLTTKPEFSEKAKRIRFSLYALEQKIWEKL